MRAAEYEPAVYNYLKRGWRNGGISLFSQITSNGMRGNGCKLHQGRFRKNLFTKRMIKHWNRLCRAVAELPSLEGFKRFGALADRFSGRFGGIGLMV